MRNLSIRSAKISDLANLKALLSSCKLTTEGLTEHIDHFLVGEIEQEFCAAVGLEIYNSDALLRSFAVKENQRANGLGKLMYLAALDLAKKNGVRQVFILTETAERFFEKAGFKKLARESAPNSIKATSEFREICPASAAFMKLRL